MVCIEPRALHKFKYAMLKGGTRRFAIGRLPQHFHATHACAGWDNIRFGYSTDHAQQLGRNRVGGAAICSNGNRTTNYTSSDPMHRYARGIVYLLRVAFQWFTLCFHYLMLRFYVLDLYLICFEYILWLQELIYSFSNFALLLIGYAVIPGPRGAQSMWCSLFS